MALEGGWRAVQHTYTHTHTRAHKTKDTHTHTHIWKTWPGQASCCWPVVAVYGDPQWPRRLGTAERDNGLGHPPLWFNIYRYVYMPGTPRVCVCVSFVCVLGIRSAKHVSPNVTNRRTNGIERLSRQLWWTIGWILAFHPTEILCLCNLCHSLFYSLILIAFY